MTSRTAGLIARPNARLYMEDACEAAANHSLSRLWDVRCVPSLIPIDIELDSLPLQQRTFYLCVMVFWIYIFGGSWGCCKIIGEGLVTSCVFRWRNIHNSVWFEILLWLVKRRYIEMQQLFVMVGTIKRTYVMLCDCISLCIWRGGKIA